MTSLPVCCCFAETDRVMIGYGGEGVCVASKAKPRVFQESASTEFICYHLNIRL